MDTLYVEDFFKCIDKPSPKIREVRSSTEQLVKGNNLMEYLDHLEREIYREVNDSTLFNRYINRIRKEFHIGNNTLVVEMLNELEELLDLDLFKKREE